jgi:hypothetical protein
MTHMWYLRLRIGAPGRVTARIPHATFPVGYRTTGTWKVS